MKNSKLIFVKLFIVVTIMLLFLASKFKSSIGNETVFINTTSASVPDSQFIIGAFHNATDTGYTYQDSLYFNTWHQYTGPNWGWLNDTNDQFYKDTSEYKSLVTGVIDRNNNEEGMRTFMDRPVIQYIISGQRVDYQCEAIDSGYQYDPYWFYAYRHSLNNESIYDINDYTHGDGARVKWCKNIPQEPGYILIDSGLRSNREMSFSQVNNGWLRDSTYDWYVLPRIRIDSAYAADVNHNNDTICKIIITGWKGNIEEEYYLKVRNFKDNDNGIYNGNYMESFYDNNYNLKYLKLDKSKLKNFYDSTIGVFDWSKECKCDIKIYWSGLCDMWIDRVRIENFPAHQYLTLKESRWINKVNSEIFWAGSNYNQSNPKPNYFYFEECQMSHFPAISTLNQQIMNATQNKNTLIIWLNYDLFKAHVPYCWDYQFDSEMLKKYLYDDYGLRTIMTDSYAFNNE